jgi:hypothetical protein
MTLRSSARTCNLYRSKTRCRIGCKKRVAGTGGEYHDAALFQMTNSATTNVVLTDFVDLKCRHDSGNFPVPLERVLHCERVDDGPEHAHLVTGHAVHTGFCKACASEDIATADDEPDFDAGSSNFRNFSGHALDHRRIYAVFLTPKQRLSAELQEDSLIGWRVLPHSYLTSYRL